MIKTKSVHYITLSDNTLIPHTMTIKIPATVTWTSKNKFYRKLKGKVGSYRAFQS